MAKPPTRSTIDQRMRKARRLGRRPFLAAHANRGGSDNWYVDHEGVLYDVKALWAAAHRPSIPPSSFQTYDAVAGLRSLGYETVSGVGAPHGLPGDVQGPAIPTSASTDDAIRALHDPVKVPDKTHYKPTGYWLFLINPARWDAEAWRASGERELLYLVSKDDRQKMQPGDLGLLRLNRQAGKPATLITVVEALSAPAMLDEPDTRFFVDPREAALALRTRLSVITGTDETVSAAAFPDEPIFQYVHNATPRTTIPSRVRRSCQSPRRLD